jgi:hypothetical protein
MRSIDSESDNTVSVEDTSYFEDERLLGSIGELDEVQTAAGWSHATPRIFDPTDESWEDKQSLMTPTEDRIQSVFFFTTTLLNIGLMVVSLYILVGEPRAMKDFLFFGVVGPSQLIQIFVGITSSFYGAFALYKRKSDYERSRTWFRRYLRTNKLFLLNWLISTSTCVYGCWKYNMLYVMDKENPSVKKFWDHVNGNYSMFIIDILFGVTDLFWFLRGKGVDFEATPFPFVFGVGRNPWLAGVFIVLIPSVVLGVAIWFQHRYYMKKYFQIIKHK